MIPQALFMYAKISRDLLHQGYGLNVVFDIIDTMIEDCQSDKEHVIFLNWEKERLRTWHIRKPFMGIDKLSRVLI